MIYNLPSMTSETTKFKLNALNTELIDFLVSIGLTKNIGIDGHLELREVNTIRHTYSIKTDKLTTYKGCYIIIECCIAMENDKPFIMLHIKVNNYSISKVQSSYIVEADTCEELIDKTIVLFDSNPMFDILTPLLRKYKINKILTDLKNTD